MYTREIFVILFLNNFCPSFTENKNFRWRTKSTAELNCDGLSEFFDQDVHDDSMELSYPHKMYTVMTSVHNMQRLSKAWTGKEMRSANQMKKVCPYEVHKSDGRKISVFGKESNCVVTSSGSGTGLTRTKCSGPVLRYRTKLVYIWSDAKRYALALFCIKNSLHWILKSKKPSVDTGTKKIVMRKISQIGFDPNNAVVVPHDKCKNTKK